MSILSAIGGIIGGLFGGGGGSAPQPQAAVSPVDMSPRAVQNDAALISFFEGVMREAGGQARPQTTAFDPVQAIMGDRGQQRPQLMQQTNNQRGGMAHPGYAGQGLFDDNLGPGRGGGDRLRQKFLPGGNGDAVAAGGMAAKTGTGTAPGGTSAKIEGATNGKVQKLTSPDSNAFWRALLGGLSSQGHAASNQLTPQFSQYLGQALSGQAGLQQEAYQQALLGGQQTLNAQAARSREQLADNMGARGLLQSGLMARGLRGVEEARQASMGDLISGLAQQNMQARVEAQRQAAQIYPAMVGAESNRFANIARAWLGERQLELEKQRLGVQSDAYKDQQDAALWQAIGAIAGGFLSRPAGAQSGAAAGSVIGGGSGSNMQGMQPFIF